MSWRDEPRASSGPPSRPLMLTVLPYTKGVGLRPPYGYIISTHKQGGLCL